MALMIRSNSLIRKAISRTLLPKPWLDFQNLKSRHLSHCLQKHIFQHKYSIKLDQDAFKEVQLYSRSIQQASPYVAEQGNRRRQPFKSQETNTFSDLDKAIFKLDVDVRRLGRLSKIDVENIYNQVKSQGKATSTQGLLIIRCCGALLPEESRPKRIELSDRIWKTLQEKGCVLDVSHYNALLKVCIENEQSFSPIEFLSNMEQKGIQANRVTYQRLIGAFCQKGDIDGASKILEFMKEKEIPVNEMVFNELILGHAKANDMNGAKDIIEVMRNSKLEPSAETYFTLAQGYAIQGNLEAIIETVNEAERNDVFLNDKHYLDVIKTLARNGYEEKVEEILSRMKKNVAYNQECINTCLELLNDGHDEVAFKIFLTMPRTTLQDGSLASAGNFLIRQMVRIDRPVDSVLSYCQKLEDMKMNSEAMSKGAEASLIYKRPDHALAFIDAMAKKGFPIRNHYFWPVLIQKSKLGEDAIYDVLKVMCNLACLPNYDTYIDYSFPYMNVSEPKIVVQKLKEFGQQAAAVVNPLVAYYIRQNQISQAASLVEEYPVRLSPMLITKSLAFGLKSFTEIESVMKILIHLKDNPEVAADQVQRADWCGQFLMDCASRRDLDLTIFREILKNMLDKDLQISLVALDNVQSLMKGKLPKDIITALENLASSDIASLPNQFDSASGNINHPRNMKVGELEDHLIELRSKGMNVRGVLRRLLLLHCRFRNLDRVMEIKKELDDSGFIYSGAMLAQLMDICVYSEKLQEALEFKEAQEKCDPDLAVDTYKILNLAALMVKNGRMDDAFEIIQKQYEKHGCREKGDFLVRNVYRVLSAVAETGNVEATNKMFEFLVVRCGYAKPSNILLGTKIKACLIGDNLPRALEEFELAASIYKSTPFKNEIFKQLIAKEDTEKLQKVIDVTKEIHGEVNVLYDLACAFIESDRIKQAKKIFETPGLRAYNNRLESICDNFIVNDKIIELEHLVNVTKDLFDIDRDKMYYNLLKGYAKINDVEKASGVWTAMQEEDIQPSLNTIRFLAEFLKKNNQPIPFEVPALPNTLTQSEPETSDLTLAIQENNLEQTLNIKKKLEESGVSLNSNVLSNIIELCIQQQSLKEAFEITKEMLCNNVMPFKKVLKFLVKSLMRAGDFDALHNLRGHLKTEDLKFLSFDNNLANSYINSGQPEKLMKMMENSNEEAFPAGGILALLQTHPEFENRVINVADKLYNEKNFAIPKNMLWQHYLRNGYFDKADKVMESCPEMKKQLLFSSLLNHVREKSDLPLAEKLTTVVSNCDLGPKAKGLAYSFLIDVLVDKEKVETALEKLEEGREILSLSDFLQGSLIRLSNSLKTMGKAVPFEIADPKSTKKFSSSSSESSDDEKKTK